MFRFLFYISHKRLYFKKSDMQKMSQLRAVQKLGDMCLSWNISSEDIQ